MLRNTSILPAVCPDTSFDIVNNSASPKSVAAFPIPVISKSYVELVISILLSTVSEIVINSYPTAFQSLIIEAMLSPVNVTIVPLMFSASPILTVGFATVPTCVVSKLPNPDS